MGAPALFPSPMVSATTPAPLGRLMLALITVVALVLSLVLSTPPARADTAPENAPGDPVTPTTVAADALPTAQINGVVWAQLIVGDTVYVGGEFTRARPAGAAAGTSEVVRTNLLAYNLATGVLSTSFAPTVNGAVRALAASTDGSRLYLGGAFTAVNGVARYRLAALSTGSGALVTSWAPQVNARVTTVGVTASTVYVGGIFSSANGVARQGLAAFSTASGAVQAWTGSPTGGNVNTLTVSPDGAKVVVGGSFTAYNGSSDPGYGMAATDATTGASLPWKVNSLVRNGGPQASILSLTSSAEGVFGTGYVFGTGGNLEGAFRASWADGSLIWLEDCHGDTYSAAPVNDAVYTTGHPHYCGNIGGFPQADPWTYHRTLTFGMEATGTITADQHGYYNFAGTPRPSLLTFYPDINTGTYTGQGQGPWSVAANEDYVLYGGEFTIVNNKKQQGLVRFATSAIAPNKEGPRLTGADFVPSVASFVAGTARLSWQANYDRDNENLSYEVLRDGVSVKTLVAASSDWNRPMLAWTDTGLTSGQTYSYRLRVSDPFGNVRTGNSVPVTVVAAGSLSSYAADVLGDGARTYWPLGEAGGTTAFDWASGIDASVRAGVTRDAPGAILGANGGAAARFDGSAAGYASTDTAQPSPGTFTVEAWVKTTSTAGGKIVGFGASSTGISSSYDRHVYMDDSGRIWFGVYPGVVRTVNSAASYNDGQWHQVVASLGEAGMVLYVDGQKVAQRSDVTNGQTYDGFWRIGGDNIGGWPSQPSSAFIAADIDEVAVYDQPLSLAQVISHYEASGRVSPAPSSPTDAYGRAVYNSDPDLYWRMGEPSGTVAADSSRAMTPGTYSGQVTQGAAGLVTGTGNPAAAFAGGIVSSTLRVDDPRVYSLEAWFSSTSTQGGKIIGFGDQQTGLSGNYDRHVYLQDDGKLVFGTWTGTANTITTPNAYNDGRRHHVVAVQSSAGMKLYVDGGIVGTNPQPAAQSYSGYWRVGGDPTWGSSNPYFTGVIDEVAVYARDIGAVVVRNHFTTGTAGEPVNAAPTAAFDAAIDALTLRVDGSASTDADGTIAGYAWNFGDGATATGKTAGHDYAAPGDYAVTLTVTDNAGLERSVSTTVTAAAPQNQAPTAAFTVTASDLSVSVDGSAAADADGSIAGYAWDFGDGATATGAVSEHEYAAAGDYTVTLTVTDDDAATGSTERSVTVSSAPTATAFAADSFERAVTGGLGQAERGGAWTVSGSTGNYAVNGGAGTLRAATAGSTVTATLPGVSSVDTEVRVSAALQQAATGSGAYLSVLGRKVGTEDYRGRVKVSATGAVQVQLLRGATTLKASTIAGLVYTTGDRLNLAVQVTGTSPTTLRAKVWRSGTPEPTDWQVTASDNTASLQKAGAIGLSLYLGGTATTAPVTAAFDDLRAGPTSAGPPPTPDNLPPVAAFTATATDLAIAVDARGSVDADGTISGYAWDFGDGARATGITSGHVFAAAGTYPVSVTVTDDDGASVTTVNQVTVRSAPAGGDLARDAFGRTVPTGLGAADVGGAWTTTGSASNYAVGGGVATLRSPTAGAMETARLGSVASTSTDVSVVAAVQQPATGSGTYLSLLGRTVSADDYRARVRLNADGSVTLQLMRGSTALRSLLVPGLRPAVGDRLAIRLQVTGTTPSTLRARVWAAGQSEPAAWQLQATDATAALQVAGGIGIALYVGGTATNAPATARFDDLVARPVP